MTPELTSLIKELQQLAGLPPVERAKRCPGLIDAAKAALARERDAAAAEAYDSGDWSQAAIGRELGKPRQKIQDMIARHRKQAGGASSQDG